MKIFRNYKIRKIIRKIKYLRMLEYIKSDIKIIINRQTFGLLRIKKLGNTINKEIKEKYNFNPKIKTISYTSDREYIMVYMKNKKFLKVDISINIF